MWGKTRRVKHNRLIWRFFYGWNMGQLTKHGFKIERLDEIVEKLENGFRSIYGADINVDPDAPDGQMIGLIAQIKADMEEVADTIYKALDPELASGAWLEQRVAYAGLIRRQASHSYLRAKLSGRFGTLIPQGSIIEDEKRQRWLTTEALTIAENSEVLTTLKSDLMGAFSLTASSELQMITRVLGWESVTPLANAVEGSDEESDFKLRQRFFKSRARPAFNSADGIVADIFQLPDVIDVECLENYTNVTDANGVPGHSINVIVEGGDDFEIANIIRNKKTAGTGLMGKVEIEIANSKGIKQKYRFDRPTIVDCKVYLEVIRQENYTAIDTQAIIDALTSMKFNIGEDVFHSRLFTPINTAGGFWVKSLQIGKRGQTLSTNNILIGPRELARFNTADIEVLVL